MTDIQGTPERVWALLKVLDAQGGTLPRTTIRTWMDPFEADPRGTALGNTISAADSLGFVESDGGSVRLTVGTMPSDIDAFADRVHARLVQTPADHGDSVVLEVIAWFIARSAKEQNTAWIADKQTEDLCNLIRAEIRIGDDDKRFNSTRYPRWRDWIGFMGLGVDIPRTGNSSAFYPYATERVARMLRTLATELPTNKEIEAGRFLKALATEMPYIDGGRLFDTALKRVKGSGNPREISPVVSVALRDLDAEGKLELRIKGDARDAFTLASDPTAKIRAFHRVVLRDVDD